MNEISLKSIKSLVKLKQIFSHIYETKKLKLIKNNKYFQTKLGIDINYYKKISGKNLVIERNGKVKEYKLNTNILIFSGKYINGHKNGYGEEYHNNGIIKFHGEYLNGKKYKGKEYDKFAHKIKVYKKDGKVEEYYNNGNIQFKGEYLNGKRWNGIGYNIYGIEEFEIKYGRGFVKEYYFDGKLKFEGEYVNGERFEGKKYSRYGNIKYEGKYLNGKKWNGTGKKYDYVEPSILEIINLYHRNSNSEGVLYKNSKLILEEEYLNGEKTGKVKEYFHNGNILFDGYYLNGVKYNGKGYNMDGHLEFEIKNGTGKIKEYLHNGTVIFEGKYLNGKKNGKGKEYYNESNIRFVGEYNVGEMLMVHLCLKENI